MRTAIVPAEKPAMKRRMSLPRKRERRCAAGGAGASGFSPTVRVPFPKSIVGSLVRRGRINR